MKVYMGKRVKNPLILTSVLNRNRLKPTALRPGRFMPEIEHAYAVMRKLSGSQSLSGGFSFVFVQRYTAGPLCFTRTLPIREYCLKEDVA
jgi:hypothetical protein